MLQTNTQIRMVELNHCFNIVGHVGGVLSTVHSGQKVSFYFSNRPVCFSPKRSDKGSDFY